MNLNEYSYVDFYRLSYFSLIVDNIGIEDDGVYTITASNSVGETIATAKLVCHSMFIFNWRIHYSEIYVSDYSTFHLFYLLS